MKVCPVCNETFADDLKFCDLDGTRLKREVGSETPEKHNKTWSLVGVGLLVGALVLSALSIIFLPKARIAPTVASSEPGTAITSTRPPDAQTDIAESASADTQAPEIIVEEVPTTEIKKKDAAQQNINGNANGAAPNPKAAAKEAGDDETPAQVEPITAAPPPPPREPEPAPAVVKPTADTRDAGSASASTEMKRDPKRDSSKSKDDEDKKSDGKKADDKKKKKGGGLFGAFKKIFGKD